MSFNLISWYKNNNYKVELLHISLALLAVASMFPYFTWKDQNLYFSVLVLINIFSYLYSKKYQKIIKTDLMWAIFFCIFLIYLSSLYTSVHTHKKWFLLIPSMFILFSLNAEDKIKTAKIFSTLFAVSLIPGIIVWILMFNGVHIPFTKLEPNSIYKAAENIYYFHYYGAVFQSDTVFIIPSGGMIARLVGIYDEPGTVGTFAALFLTFNRFKFKDNIPNIFILIGGVLSFSLAFYVITLVALLLTKKNKFFLVVFLVILTIFVFCLFWEYSPLHLRFNGHNLLNLDNLKHMENLKHIDNRSSNTMEALFNKYLHADLKTLFFGISSDANAVYDGYSSTWKIILTNYGLVGFLYIGLFLLSYVITKLQKSENRTEMLVFLMVFLINIYQRPFIWIPSYMLLFTGAIALYSYKTRKEIVVNFPALSPVLA